MHNWREFKISGESDFKAIFDKGKENKVIITPNG